MEDSEFLGNKPAYPRHQLATTLFDKRSRLEWTMAAVDGMGTQICQDLDASASFDIQMRAAGRLCFFRSRFGLARAIFRERLARLKIQDSDPQTNTAAIADMILACVFDGAFSVDDPLGRRLAMEEAERGLSTLANAARNRQEFSDLLLWLGAVHLVHAGGSGSCQLLLAHRKPLSLLDLDFDLAERRAYPQFWLNRHAPPHGMGKLLVA